jgi:PiT family inorganic phosphate transporter
MFSPTLTSSKSDVLVVLGSALFSAFMWGVISWWRAWPTSNNHALFAGLAGASWAMMGVTPFHNKILRLVLGVLILSPILGFALSTVLTALLRYLGEWITIRMKSITDGLHVMACLMVSCAHGSNDGQMVMGALLLALGMIHIQTGSVGAFVVVPGPIRFAVAGAIALGVLLGGRRILKQMGMKFYRIRDVQGLGAQLTAAGTVLTCTMIGFPASTTQVVAGSIVGAGVAKNPRAVRWHIAQEIILSWFMTLPTVGLLSYVVCRGVAWFLR